MNHYRFPDKKITGICMFLYLMALQMVARSTMYTSLFLGFFPAQMIMFGLVGAGGLGFLIYNRNKICQILTDPRVLVVLGFALVILGNMVIKQDWKLIYFSMFLYIGFAVFLSYFLTLEEAAGYYVGILFFFSVLTLLGQFILKPLANMGIIPGFPFDSPGGWHMYNFGLTFAVNKNTEMVDALRVFGIFREPGLFQVFLFIAIHLNNYNVRWDKEWKMWAVNAVLFLTLLITFCTGGVVALALYIVFLFFDKGMHRNKKLLYLAIAAVAAGICVIVYAIAKGGTWAMELVWMIQKVFEKTDSYTTRMDSIFVNARTFLTHPLIGEKIETVMYSLENNTASSPILFASFGIVGGCVHVLSWVALAWKKERHWIMNVILLVILFMPFNTQNVIHDMFFWTFPVIALTQWCVPRLEAIKAKKKV